MTMLPAFRQDVRELREQWEMWRAVFWPRLGDAPSSSPELARAVDAYALMDAASRPFFGLARESTFGAILEHVCALFDAKGGHHPTVPFVFEDALRHGRGYGERARQLVSHAEEIVRIELSKTYRGHLLSRVASHGPLRMPEGCELGYFDEAIRDVVEFEAIVAEHEQSRHPHEMPFDTTHATRAAAQLFESLRTGVESPR